jgi:small subunit ribosomal protein S6
LWPHRADEEERSLRGYELILIVDPEITEDEVNTVTNKVTETITQIQGRVVKVEKWGKRKLAYKIKKSPKGHYVIIYFMASPQALKELERTLRYNEKVIRYQLILTGVAPAVSEAETVPEEQVIPKEDILSPPEEAV